MSTGSDYELLCTEEFAGIRAHLAAIKDLLLWCREQRIQAGSVRIGEMAMEFSDARLIEDLSRPPARITRSLNDEIGEEGSPPESGSVDELFAESLGVDLAEGTKEPV